MLIRTASKIPAKHVASEDVEVFLIPDNWNDWYAWTTMFYAHVFTDDGNHHELGSIKVAEKGAAGTEEQKYRPQIPPEGVNDLGPNFVSLGQDENYYQTAKGMSDTHRAIYMRGMRDCAFDLSIIEEFQDDDGFLNSVIRSVTLGTIRGRYHRLAHGNATLTRFAFTYSLPFGEQASEKLPLDFEVIPESKPPTNVHVLIGRNAVGKTRALNLMVRALVEKRPAETVGSFGYRENSNSDVSFSGIEDESEAFSGVVSVSFSAFDKFYPYFDPKKGLEYDYVGLKQRIDSDDESGVEPLGLPPKNLAQLAAEFANSAAACRVGRRSDGWRKVLTTLESDPLFEEVDIKSLARSKRSRQKDMSFFSELSSGHGIVLLIVTRMVELVEEKTLVLIDEPETHLHPPLLSAFVRALSSHLIDRNGVAIIATHSPVVLQEVPRSCVTKITRAGYDLRAERPEIETFGENVGTLTREVFGLEVTKSGFHELLRREIEEPYASYDYVLNQFGDQLGAEARSILRSMIAQAEVEASD